MTAQRWPRLYIEDVSWPYNPGHGATCAHSCFTSASNASTQASTSCSGGASSPATHTVSSTQPFPQAPQETGLLIIGRLLAHSNADVPKAVVKSHVHARGIASTTGRVRYSSSTTMATAHSTAVGHGHGDIHACLAWRIHDASSKVRQVRLRILAC